ncbi:MAG: ComF family protein [Endomicrobiales bacterium]
MFLKTCLGFFFPVTCAACGAVLPAGDWYRVCARCRGSLPLIAGLQCRKCGLPLPDGGAHCHDCRKAPARHFESIRSCAEYRGAMKDLIHKFKFRNRDYLGRFLGSMLVELVEKQPYRDAIECVLPVPMHRVKRYLRGYNQAELLAEKVAEHLGRPLLRKVLVRKRYTTAQYRLSRAERSENLRDAFLVRDAGPVRGKKLLLIDDICTTGETIERCAAVLRRAGARKVYGLTLARD